MKTLASALTALALILLPTQSASQSRHIIVQSTTSTQNSGLYDAILPEFTAMTGITVRVVAVGTGQAIKNATNCDGDVLLVHAKADEEQFVAGGYGVERFDVMYNDFVIIGPANDPASVAEQTTVVDALTAISTAKTIFASRGDDSGTHKKEMALWATTTATPVEDSGTWYRETGSGMGATLNIAVGMGAYTMSDRATWIAFENKRNHKILFEGDPDLFNQYGVIRVSPESCPRAKSEDAQAFVDWIIGEGQTHIAAYTRGGEQLFFPNAPKD